MQACGAKPCAFLAIIVFPNENMSFVRDTYIRKYYGPTMNALGKWIKNRRLTSELVEFLEFVSTVGIYNQKIIRRSVKMALNIRPRFGPQQNWFRIHLASGPTNGAPRRLVPLMNSRRFTLEPRLKKDRAGSLERASVAPPDVRFGSLADISR